MGVSNVFSLGRCTATFNSQDMGIVEQAKATFDIQVAEVYSEAYASPVDAINKGIKASVEFIISEQDFDVLASLDGFTKVVGTATTGTKVTVGGVGGAAATSGELTLVSSVTARQTVNDVTLHKAVMVNSQPVIGWNPEEPAQKGFLVKFVGLVDSSKSDGDMVGSIGANDAAVS